MEFLLLWADELDDALGALRHLLPRILSLLCALALFAGTGFALVLAPHATLAALALVLSATLVEAVRRRRRQLASHDSSSR
jgi:hypothetical protein